MPEQVKRPNPWREDNDDDDDDEFGKKIRL
jgi:hypothetical protein